MYTHASHALRGLVCRGALRLIPDALARLHTKSLCWRVCIASRLAVMGACALLCVSGCAAGEMLCLEPGAHSQPYYVCLYVFFLVNSSTPCLLIYLFFSLCLDFFLG